MDAASAIALVLTTIKTLNEVAPVAYQAIEDIKPFAIALYRKVTGGEISDADLEALEAQIDALSAELQAPMPPED